MVMMNKWIVNNNDENNDSDDYDDYDDNYFLLKTSLWYIN